MKMSVIAVLVGMVGLCAPALAETPHSDKPVAGLTQAQVDAVVAGKRAELEACLARMTANPHKKDADIVLALEIDDTGEVQTVTVTNVPDEVERCIAVAAVEWDFPSSDVKADASTFKCQLLGARAAIAARDAKNGKPGHRPNPGR